VKGTTRAILFGALASFVGGIAVYFATREFERRRSLL